MWKRLDSKISCGDIILTHNGTEHTAEALDMILKNIKKKGFNVVPISNLIYKDNYHIDSSGMQISE